MEVREEIERSGDEDGTVKATRAREGLGRIRDRDDLGEMRFGPRGEILRGERARVAGGRRDERAACAAEAFGSMASGVSAGPPPLEIRKPSTGWVRLRLALNQIEVPFTMPIALFHDGGNWMLSA